MMSGRVARTNRRPFHYYNGNASTYQTHFSDAGRNAWLLAVSHTIT
jgi:hypothetical protein